MNIADKIVPRQELTERLSCLERPLVFTNGVFDILHPGHVEYLAQARSLGATLVVGLNSDSSARMLEKGSDRPINSEGDRAWMLAALESVTLVTTFSERTPVALLEKIRPDIYVKGGDYDIDKLDETRLVRSYGGQARAIPFLAGYSTTALVDRIRRSKP
jgi:rfaE bifunctional protein nucleotidyltransferase chain/domain